MKICFQNAQRARENAFSIAEIVIAMALLAALSVSLYGGISFGFRNITSARQHLRATQIALEKMEIMRMYSWEQINSNGFVPGTFTAPFYPTTSGSDTNGGLVYYGTTVITNASSISTDYSNDMRLVTVTLNWTNKDIPRTLQMSTYISQYGLQRYIY